MRARLALILTILGLAMAVIAAPVAAGGGSLVIGDAGADGEVAGTFTQDPDWLGGPWLYGTWDSDSICGRVEWVNHGFVGHGHEWRTALEFPLAGLPVGATITSATLDLNATVAEGGGLLPLGVELFGYAGNGTIAAADIVGSGSPLEFTAALGANQVDVTSLLTPAAVTAGWAGFALQPDFDRAALGTGGDEITVNYDCPTEEVFPILTITYDLPNPPTPTPTPAASLADAATAPPTTGSPLATLGFAALLIGTLGVLVVANARGVVRRR